MTNRRYHTVATSMTIKLITSLTILLAAAFLIGAVYITELLIGFVIIVIALLICYLLTPREYEICDGNLKVIYNCGGKSFPEIRNIYALTEKPGFGFRLFGNGGLFCGAGIFWCKKFGIFRAYVTSARWQDYVMIETAKHKVVISPDNPDTFVKDWTES